MKTYMAMDVGGTNVNIGLVDEDGRILDRAHFPTAGQPSRDALIEEMARHLKEVAARADHKPLALTVGLPGWLDPKQGLLVEAPNMPTPGWKNVPITRLLGQALGLPVRLENDTNMYAMGVWKYGEGRGLHNLLVVTLGTGVGGGLILQDKLWYGSFASAVEIGHVPVDYLGGAVCGCGRRGCLETVASATGMSRLAREWLAAGRPTLYDGRPGDITTKVLHGLAQQGDQMALAVFRQAGEWLGVTLAGAVDLLGLEGLIIGGGAARAMEFIEPRLREMIEAHVMVTDPKNIAIRRSLLDDDAPLLGGAALAADMANNA